MARSVTLPAVSPVVTFLSDFGLADPYVASVKGVLLGCCPGLTLVDLTHAVPAHDVFAGAVLLRESCGTFPPGTAHLAVVDPGVGGARPALVARTARFTFVGPDNGLLSLALQAETDVQLFRIVPDWPVPSATFHARDVFAPAVGRLLAGNDGLGFLAPVEQYHKLELPEPRALPSRPGEVCRWAGTILRIDRFGNLITNLPRSQFDPLLEQYAFELSTADGACLTKMAPTYEAAPDGSPVVIWGSAGFLEISVREYSAAKLLGIEEAGNDFEIAFLKGEQP